VVIEGAGSPAEINLREGDIVNMHTAHLAEAPVLLAGDIDRGGVFASLYGTLELLTEEERRHVKGVLINKFRGDVRILEPGLRMLEEKIDLPVLGVVPYYHDIRIPEEDSVNFDDRRDPAAVDDDAVEIAVFYLPHISNFTDFDPLEEETDVALRYIRPGDPLGDPDLVIIPGTKNTIADYRYLDESGYLAALRDRVAAEKPVFGVCGGYQMLGRRIENPHGQETDETAVATLGLLDLVTAFRTEKTLRQVTAEHVPSGCPVAGYEIHIGVSGESADRVTFRSGDQVLGTERDDGVAGGTYIHGVFDADAFRRRFIDGLRVRKGLAPRGGTGVRFDRDRQYDKLAALVRDHADMDRIYAILERGMAS